MHPKKGFYYKQYSLGLIKPFGFMNSINVSSEEEYPSVDDVSADNKDIAEKWFSEQFESLLPRIQERWPDLAKQTLEATRGSIDDLI